MAVALELPRLPGANAGPFRVRIDDAGIIIGVTWGNAPMRAAVWKPSDCTTSGGAERGVVWPPPAPAAAMAAATAATLRAR